MNNVKRISIDVDEHLHTQLKLLAIEQNTSVKCIVTKLIESYIRKSTFKTYKSVK